MEVTESSIITYTKNNKNKSITNIYQFLFQRNNLFKGKSKINLITFFKKIISREKRIYIEKDYNALKNNIDSIHFKNVDFIDNFELSSEKDNVEIIIEDCNFYGNNLKIKGGKVKIINPKFKNNFKKNKITINSSESIDIVLDEKDIEIEVTNSNKTMLDIRSNIKDLFISSNIIYLKNIRKVDYMYLNGRKEILLENSNLLLTICKILYTPKILLKNSKLISEFNLDLKKTFIVLKNSFIEAKNNLKLGEFLLDETSSLEDSNTIIKKDSTIDKNNFTDNSLKPKEESTPLTKEDYCYKIYDKIDEIDKIVPYKLDSSPSSKTRTKQHRKVRRKVKYILKNTTIKMNNN